MAYDSSTPTRESGESSTYRDDTPSLLPGEVLGGKYLIEARLAEGGMGVVLRAVHLDLDSLVAIKLLRPELTGNEDVVARLLAEARIAASLRSKHVNRVLDVGRTGSGAPYLVLEYLEGCDLGGYLERRGPLGVTEAVDYVLQACEALAEAHAIGIVHRDLKPENLFLAEEADGGFVLKVLDFGISKAPAGRRGGRALTKPFEVVGSPTYMSPEQVRGGNVDARTDVWALGVVLHELCTGEIFFDDDSLAVTFKRILNPKDMPAPLAGREESAKLHEIVVRCLEREPEQRFQDMVELAQALAPLGSDSLQATRVAKVAAAARARFIATGSPSQPPLGGTPLALTSSRVDSAIRGGERRPASRGRRRAWGFAAAAALVLSTVAAIEYSLELPAPVATPAADIAAPLRAPASTSRDEEQATREDEVLEEVPVPPLPSPLPSASPPKVTWREPAPHVVTVVAAASTATPVSVAHAIHAAASTPPEAPTAHLAGSPAVEPASPPPEEPLDAWDPDTFGGRR
jgi:eukaryotic-like serine/threonine-protein kinase